MLSIGNTLRCIQLSKILHNNPLRFHARCFHRSVPNIQCSQVRKDDVGMPEYMKKRQASIGDIKYSTSKAAKWNMRKMNMDDAGLPFHRKLSVYCSLLVLLLYAWFRQPNDIDDLICFEGRTAEEFQEYLDKLKERQKNRK